MKAGKVQLRKDTSGHLYLLHEEGEYEDLTPADRYNVVAGMERWVSERKCAICDKEIEYVKDALNGDGRSYHKLCLPAQQPKDTQPAWVYREQFLVEKPLSNA